MKSKPYKKVALIYNPNSTSGRSKELAKDVAKQVRKLAPELEVELVGTKRAGHAEELVAKLATDHKTAVVSVSGDGGYHEVVNGVMALPAPDRPHTMVFPAGNANDHYHATADKDAIEAITGYHTGVIEVIQASWTDATGKTVERYAHSYIGLGITPAVAVALNQTNVTRWKELTLTARAIMKFRGTKLVVNGEAKRYSSLLFMNIPRMAKFFTVTPAGDTNDGQFEVVAIRNRTLWYLAKKLIRGIIGDIPAQEQTSQFTFATTKACLMQLDGEVVKLPPHTDITITCMPKALRVII